MIAEVIINTIAKELNKTYDYIIPESILNNIKIGSRVFVPFGRKKQEEGFVINIKENSKFANKEIIKIEDNILTEKNINLAKIMSKRYFCNVSDCIRLMLPPGNTSKNILNRVKDKTANFVYLKKDIEEVEFDIEEGIVKSEKQKRVLNFLLKNQRVDISNLEMIADVSRSIIKTLEKNGYIEISKEKIERNPFKNKNVKRDKPLKLTYEQQIAYNNIIKSNYGEFLIYGVTGSGKTEIYLQLIESIIKKNKTAIVLVPEISLTPQMLDRFLARFGDCIAVLHSKLSIGERYDEWNKIKNNKAKIVIGARSAIFAPVENPGIIIIDEEHDQSYKSEMSPRFNAKDIAKYFAKQNNIPLVLGSATPSMESFEKANKGETELITLTKRANNTLLPNVEIVDLRKELANGNRLMISTKLYNEINNNLEKKEQTILFLNRRGFSTFVMCRDCGYTAKCKRCNISLTYHEYSDTLKCHYCGYEIKNLQKCPSCNSKNIRYFGTGTEKLQHEIENMFPNATTIRMDIDTVNKKNSHEDILNKFKNQNIDILIGTQMVVKGHHFPNVTLVGVIAADNNLNIEDYRANERTFDILTQVAGRAGREKEGRVIIQTYNPDNFVIQCAKEQNYDKFYNTEIELRRQLKYPPFCDIILFGISSSSKEEVNKAANELYKILQSKSKTYKIPIELYNPVISPISKIKNKYRWRIIAKCNLNNTIVNLVNNTLEEYYRLKFKNTRVVADINPNNMN